MPPRARFCFLISRKKCKESERASVRNWFKRKKQPARHAPLIARLVMKYEEMDLIAESEGRKEGAASGQTHLGSRLSNFE